MRVDFFKFQWCFSILQNDRKTYDLDVRPIRRSGKAGDVACFIGPFWCENCSKRYESEEHNLKVYFGLTKFEC